MDFVESMELNDAVGKEIARPDYPLSEYANEKTIFLEEGLVSYLWLGAGFSHSK
jgi:hypothetical protein